MSELDSRPSWRSAPLAELTTKMGSGATPRGGQESYKNRGVPLIRSMNVHMDGLRTDGMAYIDDKQASALDSVTVAASDVLLNITGASIGRVTVAPDWADGARVNQHVMILRTTSQLSPRFLQGFLASPEMQREINGTQQGATRQALTKQTVSDFQIPLPPLPEQRRIVAKLESLQARSRRAREALEAVPPLLEKLRQSILAAAFRGDLTKDWRDKHPDVEPASELLKRIRIERRKKWEEAELAKMKAKGKAPSDDRWKAKYVEPEPVDDEDLPELPEGWCWASVEELSTKVVDGVHKKPEYVEAGIPFLTVRNLTAGPGISFEETSFVTAEDHEEFGKRADPEFGDLLITKDGTLGVTRLIRSKDVFSIFVSLALVKPANRRMGEYLELAFQSPYFQERFVATGSGLQHIHLVDLRAALLPIAPLREHGEIVRLAKNACSRIDTLALGHAGLANDLSVVDSAILSKAFRGELVPQDPSEQTEVSGVRSIPSDGAETPRAKGRTRTAAKGRK